NVECLSGADCREIRNPKSEIRKNEVLVRGFGFRVSDFSSPTPRPRIMPKRNFFAFLLCSILLLVGLKILQFKIWPPPERKPPELTAKQHYVVSLPGRLAAAPLGGPGIAPAFQVLGELALGQWASDQSLRPPRTWPDTDLWSGLPAGLAPSASSVGLGDAYRLLWQTALPQSAAAGGPRRPPVKEVAVNPQQPPIILGDGDPSSRFHLKVVLDRRGAGVRQVILNKFQQADHRGQPV